ncbi:hypothetical protein PVK06_004617 [Gossypium arboreum]|uniref:Uncharacterized protein n=1 Tax=Gossypium arboreum TaxID=29729 RepID=A0ABR0QSH8_GOSAR|nr:hypothetical protein PVK06_004617 [Gossypium arboreum]
MAKTRGSVKKTTKSVREHASSTTTVRELESPRPVQTNEPDAATTNEVYNTKVDVDEHCEFMDDIRDEKRDLLQREIVPFAGEEVLENKGPINEASIKRITRGNNTPILKEAKTSKTRKGKAKSDKNGTNLNVETSLWHKLKDVEEMVSDTEKEKESRELEKCLRKIDSLFDDSIFADQEDTVFEKEIAAAEEEIVAEEEEVAENKKEKEEKDFVEMIITAPESMVVYIGPLQVASPTQTTTNNTGTEPGTEEQSEDCAKPKEKKRKSFKNKKNKRMRKRKRGERNICIHIDGYG